MDTTHTDPRLDAVCEQLRTERRSLEEAVALVPPHRRQTRPAPDRWSVAEVIAHLAIVEHRIAALLGPLAASAPAMTEPAAAAAPAIDMATLLDRTRRFAAPAPLHPPADADAERAMEELRRARVAMLDAIRGVDGRALDAPHAADAS
jgi:hypothetical protein